MRHFPVDMVDIRTYEAKGPNWNRMFPIDLLLRKTYRALDEDIAS